MPEDKPETPASPISIRDQFAAEPSGKSGEKLFTPDELDIYVNKVTLDAYIFHGKEVHYDEIDHLEYDPQNYTVDVVRKDRTRIDLGVKIQWLIRPYISKAKEIQIIKTKDGKSIDGIMVPLVHKGKSEKS